MKNPPHSGVGEAVRPRTKPKPKVKSQTVSGIALPGLADASRRKKSQLKIRLVHWENNCFCCGNI